MLFKITKDSGIPLMGVIAFGVIDRGTNLLQVRGSTACNLKCLFCSTGANDSKNHPTEFLVEVDYLLSWVKDVLKIKGNGVEINLDSVGEPSAYPDLVKLVSELKKMPEVNKISMQTNGTLLTAARIKELEEAGLDHINLSIDTLDVKKGAYLRGCETYNVQKLSETAKLIKNSKIELLLAPVWLPDVNDEDVKDLIKFAKELNCKMGIQKYEVYKYGRRMKEAGKVNWWKFYKQLEAWEKEFGIKLKATAKDFEIERRTRVEEVFEAGERVQVEIKAPGWQTGQMIGVARNRCISINDCSANIGDKVNIKILETKNNIYVADMLEKKYILPEIEAEI